MHHRYLWQGTKLLKYFWFIPGHQTDTNQSLANWWKRRDVNATQSHVIIGSIDGLSLIRYQIITWIDYNVLQVGSRRPTYRSKQKNRSKQLHLKTPYAKWRPFCSHLDFSNALRPRQRGMAAILQTLSNSFSWLNIIVFIIYFVQTSLNLFPTVQLTNNPSLFQEMFCMWQAIFLGIGGLIHRHEHTCISVPRSQVAKVIQHKMSAILHTTFPNAFLVIKLLLFDVNFTETWNLFPGMDPHWLSQVMAWLPTGNKPSS